MKISYYIKITGIIKNVMQLRSMDQCEENSNLNTTSIPFTNDTIETNFDIDHEKAEYPLWHLIFWVSPHFQMFIVTYNCSLQFVSAMVALFAIPVSYFTGTASLGNLLLNTGDKPLFD